MILLYEKTHQQYQSGKQSIELFYYLFDMTDRTIILCTCRTICESQNALYIMECKSRCIRESNR